MRNIYVINNSNAKKRQCKEEEKWQNENIYVIDPLIFLNVVCIYNIFDTGELGYDGPLYDRFLHMTDNMLGPSPMHIKYSSYVYDGFCIWRTNFPGPIESVISKFTCNNFWKENDFKPFEKVARVYLFTWPEKVMLHF